jgi:predicted aldo/keto reductase-like oxidoreductase|tara:strand:- start:643 stop:1083 length:441 start_codon:yes stop_codon:yes gene_type:complete
MNVELPILLDVANTLKQYDINQQSTSYKKILNTIDHRIFELCDHHIIEDCIDTDVDNCCNIRYCTECLLTIDIQFVFSYLHHSLKSVDTTHWTLYYNNDSYSIQRYWVQNNKICFSIILKNKHDILYFDVNNITRIQCDSGNVIIL